MKFRKILFTSLLIFLSLICVNIQDIAFASEDVYYLGGYPAGFSLNTRGAYIIGLSDVITDAGRVSPCKNSGIELGDIIMYIDGNEINNAKDIEDNIKTSAKKIVEIERAGEKLVFNVKPAKDINGKFRLGVFIRDSVNGIGTITYFKNDTFASLGHPIVGDNNEILKIKGGSLCMCSITGTIRGERGKAGELRGAFLKRKRLGSIESNLNEGVYGKIERDLPDDFVLRKIELGQAKPGNATIFTTVNGNVPKEYKISLIKVDNKLSNKNFVIKINDRALLDETGGVVQGMSGSPIVQDGKLVGAVTHVFINDPTRGFGLSIYNMINN